MLFASGMAAAAALLLDADEAGRRDRDGRTAATTASGAWPTTHLEPRGVEVRLAPPAELAAAARRRRRCSGSRRPRTPSSRSTTSPRWPRPRAAAGALTVVDNTTAGPLLQRPLDLGARRDAHERHQADERPRRPACSATCATRDAEPRSEPARLAPRRRRDPGPVRGLAGPPLAAHARAAARARLRQRAGAGPAARRSRRRARRCAIRACPATRATRWPGARCAATAMVVSFDLGREERAERFLAARAAGHRRHELRQRAHHRRAARALGRRRRAAGLHPPVRRLRGHGRPAGRRGARARSV